MNLRPVQPVHFCVTILGTIQSIITIMETTITPLPTFQELATSPVPEDTASYYVVSDPHYDRLYVYFTNVTDIKFIYQNISLSPTTKLVYIIRNSSIGNITRGVFENLRIHGLLLEFCKVENFDLFNGFHGLEDSLLVLYISHVQISNLKFSPGDRFTRLALFGMTIPLESQIYVDPLIPLLPGGLLHIYLENFEVASLEQLNFQRFPLLKILSLQNDGLNSVKRSFLPEFAFYFENYTLSYNPITSLPENMFYGMPALRVVRLIGTHLKNLPFHIFYPVLSNLQLLEVGGIPLNCDCYAAWLHRYTKLWGMSEEKVVCYEPSTLAGQTLDSLDPIGMCYNCRQLAIRPSW